MMHSLFDSAGHALHLTPSEYTAYKKDEHALWMKYYAIERDRRGIWASNKDRYLREGEQLGQFDNHFMENSFNKDKPQGNNNAND